MNQQVLCFGEVLWDTLPEGKTPGGAPMNVAIHLKQQGIHSTMASRIGSDEAGRELIQFLRVHDLYSDLIQEEEKLPTCVVGVELDEKRQATYTIPYPVSWDNIQPDPALLEAANKASVIVFGSLASRAETTRNTLMELLKNDALKVFDVNIRAPHFEMDNLKILGGMSNIIKMNSEELDMLAGTELAHLSQKEKISFLADYMGVGTLCITRGDSGAIALIEGVFYEHPGFKIDVLDTVGAGDAFLAAFIAGTLQAESPNAILQKACAVGAFVASHRGANPGYDLQKILEISRQMA